MLLNNLNLGFKPKFSGLKIYTFAVNKGGVEQFCRRNFSGEKINAIYYPFNSEVGERFSSDWHRITFPSHYVNDWSNEFDAVTFEVPLGETSHSHHYCEEWLKHYGFIRMMCCSYTISEAYPVMSKEELSMLHKFETTLKQNDIFIFGRSSKGKYIYLPEIVKKADSFAFYLERMMSNGR
jgi:hypothetical protein